MSQRFVEGIERFVETEGVDPITFAKGQRKDDVARHYLATFMRDEGVPVCGPGAREGEHLPHREAPGIGHRA